MATTSRPSVRDARHPAALRVPTPRVPTMAHQQEQALQSQEDADPIPRQRHRNKLRDLGVQRDKPDLRGRESRKLKQRMVRARSDTWQQEEMSSHHLDWHILSVLGQWIGQLLSRGSLEDSGNYKVSDTSDEDYQHV
jgi:hypothetical protein